MKILPITAVSTVKRNMKRQSSLSQKKPQTGSREKSFSAYAQQEAKREHISVHA